jgi:hypothetical protein
LHSTGRDTSPQQRPGRQSGTVGESLSKLLDAYAAEPGAATVDLLLCEAHQHRQLPQDGRADVALLHLPFDSAAGLDTETLYTEGQVAYLIRVATRL